MINKIDYFNFLLININYCLYVFKIKLTIK